MTRADNQFVLAYTYGGVTKEITDPGPAALIQMKRSLLKKEIQYKNGILQVRRYKAVEFRKVIDNKSKAKIE